MPEPIDFDADAMIAEGRSVMSEAIAGFDVVAIVAAFSGGDDSVVATHFAMANYPGAVVMSANTLVGLSKAVEHRRSVCRRFGWECKEGLAYSEGPPKRMRNGKPFDEAILPAGRWTEGATAYEEFCLNWGFPGRGKKQHARMYQRLKERPFRRIIKSLGGRSAKNGKKVIVVSGIRHDESAIRAGYKRAWAEGYFGDVWVNPFYWRTKSDFALYREEFGLPLNPVKRICGISGECCCGTFAADDERAAYRQVEPEFCEYLAGLEQQVWANGFPWGWGESPPGWWKRQQQDKRSGQKLLEFLEADDAPHFQPACVGCLNGRR